MERDLFNFDIDELWNAKVKKPKVDVQINDPKVQVKKAYSVYYQKLIASEIALSECLDWHWEKGATYCCLSLNDIDSLSYLRFALKQQKLKYVSLSTWCMSRTNIEEIESWIKKGLLKRIDFYVGEIFKNRYAEEFLMLEDLTKKYGGRVCMFRNHSKVMACFGENFDFTIVSSANVNTNPRCENTNIIVDRETTLFYKKFFDEIIPFNKGYENWKKYEIEKETQNDNLRTN